MSIFHTILLVLGLLVGSVVFVLVLFHIFMFVEGHVDNLLWKRHQNKERKMIGKCRGCGYDLTGLDRILKHREGAWWDEYRRCPECGMDESVEDYKRWEEKK